MYHNTGKYSTAPYSFPLNDPSGMLEEPEKTFTRFSSRLPKSQVSYFSAKMVKSATYSRFKINLDIFINLLSNR